MKKKPNKNLSKEVANELSRMLGIIDPKLIVTFNKEKGIAFIGGEKALPDKLVNLKSESEFILQSEIWKLMNETIRHMAYEIMFTKSTSFDDVRSGKMLLYHLDVMKKLMDSFKSYQHMPLQRPPGTV